MSKAVRARLRSATTWAWCDRVGRSTARARGGRCGTCSCPWPSGAASTWALCRSHDGSSGSRSTVLGIKSQGGPSDSTARGANEAATDGTAKNAAYCMKGCEWHSASHCDCGLASVSPNITDSVEIFCFDARKGGLRRAEDGTHAKHVTTGARPYIGKRGVLPVATHDIGCVLYPKG